MRLLYFVLLATACAIRPQGQYAFRNFVGDPYATGSMDGNGSSARFNQPGGLAVDNNGYLYVADSGNHTIRKITPDGLVTTLAGRAGERGTNDGIGSIARFDEPVGVAVDSQGNLYVAELFNFRKVTPQGVVSTIPNVVIRVSELSMSQLQGVAVDNKGNVYVTDSVAQVVRMISSVSGKITTLAGISPPVGYVDGTFPAGLAVDSSGNVFLADARNDLILKITPSGTVSKFAGFAGDTFNDDGIPGAFDTPTGVAVDASGTVFVTDTEHGTVRSITTTGFVSTIGGMAGQFGSADGDGTGSAARFLQPQAIAVDHAGNIFVADNNRITKGIPTRLRFVIGAGQLTASHGFFEMHVTSAFSSDLVLEQSADLHTWTPLQTNVLSQNGVTASVPMGSERRNQFFRARELPHPVQ